MGLKDVYFSLEEKFNKTIDAIDSKVPVRWFFNAVDKVIPSFVFVNLILIALIVVVLVLLLMPHTQKVTFVFKSGGVQLVESFGFTITVDGTSYKGTAEKGRADLLVNKGNKISIESIDLTDYNISKKIYDFSDTIDVKLSKIVSVIPVSIALYSPDGSTLTKPATLNFSCSSANLPDTIKQTTVSSGSTTLNVPDNCGTLKISGRSDGLKMTSGQECDSAACRVTFSPIQQTDPKSSTTGLPNGGIKVNVTDDLGNPLKGAKVSIFDASDLRDEIDVDYTNQLGFTKVFASLTVGNYSVYVEDNNFMPSTQDVTVTDNAEADVDVKLSKKALGKVSLSFVDENSDPVAGSFVLKDNNAKVIYRATVDDSGKLDMPVYGYGKFLVDFNPNNTDLFPLGNKALELSSSTTSKTFQVKTTSVYNSAKVVARVVDEDKNPVEGVKIFVRDSLTGFDLLSYDVPNTDSNGYTEVLLPQGVYVLVAKTDFAEAESETLTVAPSSSGDVPETDTTINLVFGSAILNVKVYDEYKAALPNAVVKFFKKPKVDSGALVTDAQGEATNQFKAGVPMYYVVSADNYLPYYSESRLLMNSLYWDSNVFMTPIQDNTQRVEFLGLYNTLGGEEVKAMSIGQTYYVGFRIYVYNDPKDMSFVLKSGQNNTVDQDKLYFTNAYTSADNDVRYSDSEMKKNTLGDAKVFVSKWNDATKGVYDVYYKVNVRTSSSVHLYDSLRLSWDLKVDGKSVANETKDFLAGTKQVCAEGVFCGRYTLLNKNTDLYVDPQAKDTFLINPGDDYQLTFDLINGINGANGEIKHGSLQIYNALSDSEGLNAVINDISSRSFLELFDYNLSGPNKENRRVSGNKFGVFESDYEFSDLIKNRYISGTIDFKPVMSGKSYLNFVVLDKDRKLVVNGGPVMSLLFDAESTKNLHVTTFPDRVLAPESDQNLKILVKDDFNNFVKDVLVSVKLKNPYDDSYHVLSYCKDLKTDPMGSVKCNLHAEDLLAGSLIQIIANKAGYAGYSKTDFTPDLEVTTKLFSFDKKALSVNLIYPTVTEAYDSLTVTNNSAKDITLDKVELKMSNYSQDVQGYLNVTEMKNYESGLDPKVILGRQMNYDGQSVLEGEAKTRLKNVFKAALNEQIAKDIPNNSKASGFLTFYFKTQGNDFTRTIPFNVNLVADGYPTNAKDCLIIGFDSNSSFASDGAKPIQMQIHVENHCVIGGQDSQGNLTNTPVVFDNAFVVLNHKSGALGLGSYRFNLNNGASSTELTYSVPKPFIQDWASSDVSETLGNITLVPSGVLGKQSLTIQIFGTINTSEGIKKVESDVVPFDVSVLNIKDCIKVFDDKGKEIDQLTLPPVKSTELDLSSLNPDAQKFTITLKNICSGLPLDVQICKGNDGNIPRSCGEDLPGDGHIAGYIGFNFYDSSLTNGKRSYQYSNLTDEKEITISRPTVSGAYALQIFAKQPHDFSYKRVVFLPVNVQTVPNMINPFFMDNPFLHTTGKDSNYSSDVVYVYNTDVPGKLALYNEETFLKLLDASADNEVGSNSPLYLGGVGDIAHGGTSISSSSAAHISGGQVAYGFGQAIAMAAVPWTIIGIIALCGVSMSWNPTGWITGIVSGVILLVTWIITAFASYIDDWQVNKFVILNGKDYPYLDVNLNKIVVNPNNINYTDLFKISGQDHYLYKIVREKISGYVGCAGFLCANSKSWSDNLKFNISCPHNYELDESNILVLDNGLKTPKEEYHTVFHNCWWDKAKTVSGNTVTFYPKCGADSFTGVAMDTYIVVPCKLKPELWGRATQGGISGGYSNVGTFKLHFTDINFDNFYKKGSGCNSEWCFKTYPLVINGGMLGDMNSHLRFAFHNPKDANVIINNLGFECTDVAGNITGFTGPDAKPKIAFEWSDKGVDANFCSPNAQGDFNQYCDATQFMISNIKHIGQAQEELGTLGTPKCPYMKPFFDIIPHMKTTFNDFNILEITTDDGNKSLHITGVKYFEYPDSSKQYPKYKAYFQIFEDAPKEMKVTQKITPFKKEDGTKVNLLSVSVDYVLLNLNKPSDYPSGDISLFNKKAYIFLSKCNSFGSDCDTVDTVQIDININANNWKGGCIVKNPSTMVASDGKMLLSHFYESDNNPAQKKIFEIEDILNYKVYLMDDGFTNDFLNDFVDYTDFFGSTLGPKLSGLDLNEKIRNGQFKIVNDLGDAKTMGPGLYNVHVNIVFPPKLVDISNSDTNIEIVLNKVSSAVHDNIFYYMPIDGLVGVDHSKSVIDRQGYGIDFSGDTIKIESSDTSNQTLMTTAINSDSTPKSHLDVSTTADFTKMNGSKRGTVFEARINPESNSNPVNNIDLMFIPNLLYYKLTYNMKNINTEQDTGLYYSLNYNGDNILNTNAILPWFVSPQKKDETDTDMTGQKLIDVYPKVSMPSNLNNYAAKLTYPAVSVTDIADYRIYANVFGQDKSNLSATVVKTENLLNDKIKGSKKGLPIVDNGINNLEDLIAGFDSNNLCISASPNKLYTRIFVNENKLNKE